MTTGYYPAYAPPWFVGYGYKPSTWYDTAAKVWHYLVLGSTNGDKATFCQYYFLLGAPYTASVRYPLGIPVIHATFWPVADRMYVFGQSDRDYFWQDGPAIGQSLTQKALGFVKPAVVPFKVLSKEQHDFLPVKWPMLVDDAWKRYAV